MTPLAIDAVVDKSFGERRVLLGARLQVKRGTVHAVLGENGAGKSTLLGVVAGLVPASAGRLTLGGVEVGLSRHSVVGAQARGLGLVPQHAVAAPGLTVVEHAVLGREPTRRGALALDEPAAALAHVAREVGLEVDPHARIGDLSVGAVQRAELVCALWRGAEVLILDEPTAVLSPSEADGLLALVRRLRDAGRTVVLVTHRTGEVARVADEVTVLRHGETVATVPGTTSAHDLARLVIGADPPVPTRPGPPQAAAPRLIVDGLTVEGALTDVSLRLAPGELVGVAGIDGNGQAELAGAIAGLVPVRAGRVHLAGREVTRASVAARLAAGLAHVPADRHQHGLILDASLTDNVVLGRPDLRPGRWLAPRRLAEQTAAILRAADVRPPDPALPARALSGGNQQKVVVARELGRPGLAAVVAAHPTRGVDLGAAAAICARLHGAAAAGVAVLWLSADLDELLANCHRIVVLTRGKIVGELAGADLAGPDARVQLSAWMTGAGAA